VSAIKNGALDSKHAGYSQRKKEEGGVGLKYSLLFLSIKLSIDLLACSFNFLKILKFKLVSVK
jgi:hypothetical protein